MKKYLLSLQEKIQELNNLIIDYNKTFEEKKNLEAVKESVLLNIKYLQSKIDKDNNQKSEKDNEKVYFKKAKLASFILYLIIWLSFCLTTLLLHTFSLPMMILYTVLSFGTGTAHYFLKTNEKRQSFKMLDMNVISHNLVYNEKEKGVEENILGLTIDQIDILDEQLEETNKIIFLKHQELEKDTTIKSKEAKKMLATLLEHQATNKVRGAGHQYTITR